MYQLFIFSFIILYISRFCITQLLKTPLIVQPNANYTNYCPPPRLSPLSLNLDWVSPRSSDLARLSPLSPGLARLSPLSSNLALLFQSHSSVIQKHIHIIYVYIIIHIKITSLHSPSYNMYLQIIINKL